MKNIFKKQIFVKAAFIPHLKKWVFPQPNHKLLSDDMYFIDKPLRKLDKSFS